MTPEEIDPTYEEFTRLADELAAKASVQGADSNQTTLAAMGSVLARLAKIVAECKNQLDEVTERDRNRERGADSLRDERALRLFAQLKPEDRERVVQTVESDPPNISLKAFANQVAQRVKMPFWTIQDLLEWVATWYSYLAQRESEEDVNRVAGIMLDSFGLKTTTSELLKAVDASNPASTFVQHLKRLLRCQATLGVSVKAESLLTRNERQFVYATVSTELRPIFGANVEAAPNYGIIVHNLILNIREGGNSRPIGLALTSNDVLTLGEVLNRAWKKDVTLRTHSVYKLLPLSKP